MEDNRVCPICETSNPSDAIHCEVCGERLVPEEAQIGDAASELSTDGSEVVGFAIEDSEELGEDISFGGASSDATTDGMPAFEPEVVAAGPDSEVDEPVLDDSFDGVPNTDEIDAPEAVVDASEADITDEDMMTAAPADQTATMESFDASEGSDQQGAMDEDGLDEGADSEPDDAEPEFDEAADYDEPQHEEFVGVTDPSFEPGDEPSFADDAPAEVEDDEYEPISVGAEDVEDDVDGPDYLYSPMDGTAYARGSAEYEEGFGPNGEELVATPPDAAFDALEDFDDEDASLNEVSGATMLDDELASAAAPSPSVSAEFQAAFQARRKERPVMAPLPQPGAYSDPAVLTVYANRQPVMRLAIDMDEVLIGRRDPVADAYPDLDLTELDDEAHISRKHAYIYRQNKNYTLYAVSNAGTQLNADLLDLGDRRPLSDGDVIVLAGKIAMKFELPNA